MRHLVVGQRQNAPNFSGFHWSPHSCLITIGQHFVTTRVVHLPKRTETSLFSKRTKAEVITSYCSYARSAQPGPNRTRLCGPCIAAKAGSFKILNLISLPYIGYRTSKYTRLARKLRKKLRKELYLSNISKPFLSVMCN